jgi:hypothetical protein
VAPQQSYLLSGTLFLLFQRVHLGL